MIGSNHVGPHHTLTVRVMVSPEMASPMFSCPSGETSSLEDTPWPES